MVDNDLPNGIKLAVVTDHLAIVCAQKKLNGYGGISRGYSLNRLYEYVYDLSYDKGIDVTFFFLKGQLNSADSISRHFGGLGEEDNIVVQPASDMGLPSLEGIWYPLCEKGELTSEAILSWEL